MVEFIDISLMIFTIVIIFCVLFFLMSNNMRRKMIDLLFEEIDTEIKLDNEEIDKMFEINEDSKDQIQYEKTTIEMMKYNMKEINDYYKMSKHNAKIFSIIACVSCILGLVFIGVAFVLMNSSIGSAYLIAIGGTISEIISGTSMIVYKKSQDQLHKYFEALHENEKFLSCVNLVSNMGDEKKDDAYIKIIELEMTGKLLSQNEKK